MTTTELKETAERFVETGELPSKDWIMSLTWAELAMYTTFVEKTKEKEPNRKEERKNTDVPLSDYLPVQQNSFSFDERKGNDKYGTYKTIAAEGRDSRQVHLYR